MGALSPDCSESSDCSEAMMGNPAEALQREGIEGYSNKCDYRCRALWSGSYDVGAVKLLSCQE